MAIEWNRVTWYSKAFAVIVFVGTFALAFWLGITWERVQIERSLVVSEEAAESTIGTAGTGTMTAIGKPRCAPGMMCAQYLVEVSTKLAVAP